MFNKNSLFDDPDWDRIDESFVRLARVVFPDGPDGSFDYGIPERFYEQVEPGMRLLVPLGPSNRPVVVYCVEICSSNANTDRKFRLKEILKPIDSKPLISESMLALANWIAERWLCPLGIVLEAMLPAGVRSQAGTRSLTVYSASEKAEQEENLSGLTSRQKSVLAILRASPEPLTLTELARSAKCSMVPIQTLKKQGFLCSRSIRRPGALFYQPDPTRERKKPLKLNEGQQRAFDRISSAIDSHDAKTFLLHGVTASGKTEVYLQAIDKVVRQGGQAIVLVPEISLTPQTVQRFGERFDSLAVLHSHLTDSERHVEWTRIASGEVQVVVGARSAIFAPLPNLGLIVIDEEHESSFKQSIAPRYHARTVALFRSRQERIPLILGSATPSLESWYRQLAGDYELLSLPDRVGNLSLPRVYIIDLRSASSRGFTRGAIHQQLHHSIYEALEAGGQVILLLNRRGFSTQIQCPACGEVIRCPNCEVALTHHRAEDLAVCHYCDYQIEAPNLCPKCGFAGVRYSGFGTEKLQEELASRFPNAPILRMDTDTMQGHGTHERALAAFRKGDYKILLGTQMIAKGLDFPRVTLVGVINADTALHFPDFRASERTFHLITQVAGRTGRGDQGGSVIVQTYSPEHPAIIAASRHDYLSFVQGELPERKALGYPPYRSMIRIVIRGPQEESVSAFAQSLAKELKESIRKETEELKGEGTIFQGRTLGPAPAPFTKLRGFFRWHLFVFGNDGKYLRRAIQKCPLLQKKTAGNVEWMIDVDPLDML